MPARPRKEKALDLLRQLREAGVSKEELLRAIQDLDAEPQHLIPKDIFPSDLGVIEAVVKFLHEQRGMRFADIARLTKRSAKSVWLSYRNAKSKHEGPITSRESPCIPLAIFSDDRGALEALAIHLHDTGLRYADIARILGRDARVIWSSVQRGRRK
ncbi:hypothetical protein COY28_00440 [Candidatus Woesearchaeota archaeon CG_4_10_14_0_2_um_filter_57_5]|nr:MAG: hypothetical protein AUJ68_06525 [Candidatus Woesearchaeota archaeon CG1_02_57_44]PIN68752.1 MAG: hypothetical protein COV94_03740 [Candidatus Woesearchaeota archaeon CG11_big_fil_rev_8_21_14_0_20_57_5]PIZ56940.1 MAG: hypothetical protein COY28_00440 [Candidatus Woesearchaeota archaeon CG_4_10_14_0_2_um_filter_57_5]